MKSKIPETLYKYRKFDSNSLDMLLTEKIWCANPLTFNDPLDCSPIINIEGEGGDIEASYAYHVAIYTKYAKKVKELFEGFGISKSTEKVHVDFLHAKAEELSLSFETWEQEDILSKSLIEVLNPGVFSLSEDVKSSLMWSHYADEHRGFCIGYDTHPSMKDKLYKVKYTNSNQSIHIDELVSFLDNEKQKRLSKKVKRIALLHKTLHWKYEKEWRYIEDGAGLKDTGLKISSLVFGLKFNENIQQMLMEHLKVKDVKFFKIYRVENSNELAIGELPTINV